MGKQSFMDRFGARLSQNGTRMLSASREFVSARKIERGKRMVESAKRAFEQRIKLAQSAMERLANTLAPEEDAESDAPGQAGGR